MTLADVARMLKYAKVPRSKTVELLYPNPGLTVCVPATHIDVIRAVIHEMTLPGQNVRIELLNSLDVRPNEHVLFKIKGVTVPAGKPYDDAFMPEAYFRRRRMQTARARNADVVIDFACVAS